MIIKGKTKRKGIWGRHELRVNTHLGTGQIQRLNVDFPGDSIWVRDSPIPVTILNPDGTPALDAAVSDWWRTGAEGKARAWVIFDQGEKFIYVRPWNSPLNQRHSIDDQPGSSPVIIMPPLIPVNLRLSNITSVSSIGIWNGAEWFNADHDARGEIQVNLPPGDYMIKSPKKEPDFSVPPNPDQTPVQINLPK